MPSANLNPGRKVLKAKPAVECIIMEPRSAEGEYTPPSHISHTLPACANQRQRGEGLAEEQREVYTVSNHLLLPPLPTQSIPNQSAGGTMLVKKPQPFECLLYLQTEACWNQRNYHMT